MTRMGNPLINPYSASGSAYTSPAKYALAGFAGGKTTTKADTGISQKRMALRRGIVKSTATEPVSVVDSMKLYSQNLQKQRKASKDTALAKKKLKYSFKKISSKIISSKTSTAARQVVSQAKREIEKLKDAKRTGKYDSDEIDAAIEHAKAMERIARKKARHLEQEEMAKRCSSGRDDGTAATCPEGSGESRDPVKDEIDKLRKDIEEIGEKAEEEGYIESAEVTNEMLSDICSSMEEMLDAIEELGGLMDELMSNPVHMDEEDIDAMIVKHRNREMKEITKADADYLKALFGHYDRIRADMAMPDAGMQPGSFEGFSQGEGVSTAVDVAL